MTQYAVEEAFARSAALFAGLAEWAGGEEAGGAELAVLEEEMTARGREVILGVMQDVLDLRAAREERLAEVTGPDGAVRTRAEPGHCRQVSTVLGPVTVSRIAYRAPGAGNVHPADAALGLPACRYSPGLARMAAQAAVAGSLGQACAQVTARTGCALGSRQCQQLTRAAAADFGDFYACRQHPPGIGPGQVLVLSCDGKGIVVRPGELRPRAAQVARRAAPKQDGRLSRGETRTRKRMAEVGAVYAITPVPRDGTAILDPAAPAPPGPRARDKWLTASIAADTRDVVAATFAEADRRDPDRQATWIALADGNKDQIRWIAAEAAARNITIPVICDFIHVTEYLWQAAWCFFPEASPDAGPWVRGHAAAILAGRATEAAEAIRAQSAATSGLSKTKRAAAARTARYLDAKTLYLDYPAALAAGWPISTGVIEGACRHLVKDRMDITGARWGVTTAEAILKLRALIANNDFDDYWTYHLHREHQRNHPASYTLAV